MRANMANQMIRAIVVAFTKATLEIASIFGFGRGFGVILLVNDRRGVTKHGYMKVDIRMYSVLEMKEEEGEGT